MKALTRVLAAPGLIATVAVAQLTVGAAIGSTVRTMVGTVMDRYAWFTDGHFLFGVAQMAAAEPSLLIGARQMILGSAAIAFVFWTVLAAAILRRLAAPAGAAELTATAVSQLPGVVVTTLWHLLVRAVLLAAVGAAFTMMVLDDRWGWLALLPIGIVLAYCTCALDLARCQVVLHDARRFHPRTAVDGFLQALKRPGVLAASTVLSFAQWGTAAAIFATVLSGAENASALWIARGLAVVGLLLGLTRLSVAVGAGRYRLEAAAPPDTIDP